MKKRFFEDVVGGKRRLVLIIDDPDAETAKAVVGFANGEAAPLPNTAPDRLFKDVNEIDPYWPNDVDAGMFKALSEKASKEIKIPKPVGADELYQLLVANTARSSLTNIDAVYFAIKDISADPDTVNAFKEASSKLIRLMRPTESLAEDPRKSLLCLQHISTIWMDNMRMRNNAASFKEWYEKQGTDKQKDILMDCLDWLEKVLQK